MPSGSSTIAKRRLGVTSYGRAVARVAEAGELLVLGVERRAGLEVELEHDPVAAGAVGSRRVPPRVRLLRAEEERQPAHRDLDVVVVIRVVGNVQAEPAVELRRSVHVLDDHADHVELESQVSD